MKKRQRKLVEDRLNELTDLCDPECMGRCLECPAVTVQEAIDELKRLRNLENIYIKEALKELRE